MPALLDYVTIPAGFHDPLSYTDAGSPELCPRCGSEVDPALLSDDNWPICMNRDENGIQFLTHRQSCGVYVWADDVCGPCDTALGEQFGDSDA